MSETPYARAIRVQLEEASGILATRIKAKLDQVERPLFLKDDGRAEIEALLPALKFPAIAIGPAETWPAFQSIDVVAKAPLAEPYRAMHARFVISHGGDPNFALGRHLHPALEKLVTEEKGIRYSEGAEEVLEAWYRLREADSGPAALDWITSSANEVVHAWNNSAQQANAKLLDIGKQFVKSLIEEYQFYYGPTARMSPDKDLKSLVSPRAQNVANAESTSDRGAGGTAVADFLKEPLSAEQVQQLSEIVSSFSRLRDSPSPGVDRLATVVKDALSPLANNTKEYLTLARKCDQVLLGADLRVVPNGTREIALWLVPSRTTEAQERLALRRLSETLWVAINATNARYEGHSGHGSRLPELFAVHRERFAQWIPEVARVTREFEGPPGSALFLLVEGFWILTETLFRMVESGTSRQDSLLDDWLEFASDHLILAEREHRCRMPKGGGVSQIKLFISHSSSDKDLAEAFSTLVMAAFDGLREKEIRCTSVGGHKLAIGAHSSTTLKADLASSSEVVGILTKASLESSYVLFELGAAWGRDMSVRTLLGPDTTYADLRPPLTELNVAKLTEKADVLTLLDELAEGLKVTKRSGAAIDRAVDAFLTRIVSTPASSSP